MGDSRLAPPSAYRRSTPAVPASVLWLTRMEAPADYRGKRSLALRRGRRSFAATETRSLLRKSPPRGARPFGAFSFARPAFGALL